MTDLTSSLGNASIDAATLLPLRAIIETAGLDCRDILQAAQLPHDLLDPDGERRLDLAGYFRLSEQIALAIGDETIHVSARPLILGTSGLIRDRLRGAETVRDMLEILATSYNVIHGGPFNKVSVARDELVYVMDDSDFPYVLPNDDPFILFSIEALLVVIHVLLQSSSTGDAPLPLKSFRTQRVGGDQSPLVDAGFPVVHGARHFAAHYDAAICDWPVDPASCPVLGSRTIYGGIALALERIATPAADGDIVDSTAQALRDGLHDQRMVARHLGMSIASLRRRLDERGTCFRKIRVRVLEQEAILRLERGDSVGAIAEDLGYSDRRSFTRAFRAWTGHSPRGH